jgi:hypothetical protein
VYWGLKPPVSSSDLGDVVGQVAEPEGGAAEVFEPSVDGLGGSVRGAGTIEVGQDVCGALFRVRPRMVTSLSTAGTPWLTEVISYSMRSRPRARSGSR